MPLHHDFKLFNYGTRQETIKQQDKVRDVVVGGRYQLTPEVIFRKVGDEILTYLVHQSTHPRFLHYTMV